MASSLNLELGEFVPFHVRSIANKRAQVASRTYKQQFDIGLNEWSCMAALAADPDISASRICAVSGFDKALISRSLHALETKRLVESLAVDGQAPKRLWRLTPSGQAMYRDIRSLALAREEKLLAGISSSERIVLLDLLKRMQRNVTELAVRTASDANNLEM